MARKHDTAMIVSGAPFWRGVSHLFQLAADGGDSILARSGVKAWLIFHPGGATGRARPARNKHPQYHQPSMTFNRNYAFSPLWRPYKVNPDSILGLTRNAPSVRRDTTEFADHVIWRKFRHCTNGFRAFWTQSADRTQRRSLRLPPGLAISLLIATLIGSAWGRCVDRGHARRARSHSASNALRLASLYTIDDGSSRSPRSAGLAADRRFGHRLALRLLRVTMGVVGFLLSPAMRRT